MKSTSINEVVPAPSRSKHRIKYFVYTGTTSFFGQHDSTPPSILIPSTEILPSSVLINPSSRSRVGRVSFPCSEGLMRFIYGFLCSSTFWTLHRGPSCTPLFRMESRVCASCNFQRASSAGSIGSRFGFKWLHRQRMPWSDVAASGLCGPVRGPVVCAATNERLVGRI